ncbi:hypothetical protein GCK32_021541 [Trichostrongylus colubriformis]|uniref:Uncharacterized protein n=1 Tax=Trichostrongylus colubriformis TaxID=6319 RepID=A0AAN8F160_TRICO
MVIFKHNETGVQVEAVNLPPWTRSQETLSLSDGKRITKSGESTKRNSIHSNPRRPPSNRSSPVRQHLHAPQEYP